MSNAKLINLICIGVTLLEQIGFLVIKILVLCVYFIIRKKLVPLLLVKNLCFVVKQKKYNQQKIQLGSNMTRLIAAVSPRLITDELDGKLLCNTQKAHNQIYIVNAHNAPNTMREIGRLRELSFRRGGGGSGKSYDLDAYDSLEKPFEQLIVWNPDRREIIGGYRFLLGRNATFDDRGKPVTPMSHIFDCSQLFIDEYLPYTIELGRAFVQPKYQSYRGGLKSLYSLDNLWDGIGAMIGNYEDVRYMVGKVTIYPQMQIEARYAIIYFLNHFFADEEKLFLPINEDIVPDNFCHFFEKMFSADTLKENFKILLEYLGERNERIPALIKAYIELASTMKSFGTCFDNEFGNIYDTGIMIAIDDIYSSKKERYLSYYLQKIAAKADMLLNKNKVI